MVQLHSLCAVHDLRDLVEMRIDLVRQLIEVAPFLAELGRAMRRLQKLAILPLDVIDDALAVEAAKETDRNETGLARHEARPLRHQRQRLGLFLRLRLDNVNLDHRLWLCLWHQNLHCLNELKGVRQPRSYWSRGLLSFLDSYRDLSLLQSEEHRVCAGLAFFASFVNFEVPLRSSLFESFFYP